MYKSANAGRRSDARAHGQTLTSCFQCQHFPLCSPHVVKKKTSAPEIVPRGCIILIIILLLIKFTYTMGVLSVMYVSKLANQMGEICERK